ncbi:PREDICTED: uncharacterized protein LOC102004074 isoform X2 [Chinchilla lanigera]|uniref:uncharacterized protein LOC102004074 isoform X2 n=1 Tax=Chinchilla lanigera TaxID=34839 RepID=UPI0006962AD8|nr:PREDICTED: uncharacterized protein LOC102004074 isoform X2 [Chinchilla lanigera]
MLPISMSRPKPSSSQGIPRVTTADLLLEAGHCRWDLGGSISLLPVLPGYRDVGSLCPPCPCVLSFLLWEPAGRGLETGAKVTPGQSWSEQNLAWDADVGNEGTAITGYWTQDTGYWIQDTRFYENLLSVYADELRSRQIPSTT